MGKENYIKSTQDPAVEKPPELDLERLEPCQIEEPEKGGPEDVIFE